MEPTQTGFSLNKEISNWQNIMLNGALTPDDVTELTQHLNDEIAELQSKGLNDEEAWLIARHRIGSPVMINEEFEKVNPDFIASRNWLMLFWGATLFMILQTLVIVGPGVLRFIVIRDNTDQRKLKPVMNDTTLQLILWGLCIALIILLVVNLTRANKISVWFNKLLMDYSAPISLMLIVAGSFIGFCNYAYVGDQLNGSSKFWMSKNAEDLLAIIFYGSLVFSTAYFTMRYRKQELRSFRSFCNQITWPVTLIMGMIFQLMVNSTYMFHLDVISIIITCALFGLLGWMTGHSRTFITNLLSAQTSALAIFIFGFSVNPASRLFFFMIYLVALATLIIGCFISRRNNYQSQAA